MKDNLAITNFDLDEMLKHNKSYGGTVPHNLVKTIPSNRNSSQVINLHHVVVKDKILVVKGV